MRKASSYILVLGGQAGATWRQEPKVWELMVGPSVEGEARHPCGCPPIPAIGALSFGLHASLNSSHLLEAVMERHLVASAPQFPELGLSFLILGMGVGWE